ncbi:MAG: hypothetical protein MPJ50_09100 [Pirellulales bacterium]|nr:hypothetical protein [Pirellulales bacterium]
MRKTGIIVASITISAVLALAGLADDVRNLISASGESSSRLSPVAPIARLPQAPSSTVASPSQLRPLDPSPLSSAAEVHWLPSPRQVTRHKRQAPARNSHPLQSSGPQISRLARLPELPQAPAGEVLQINPPLPVESQVREPASDTVAPLPSVDEPLNGMPRTDPTINVPLPSASAELHPSPKDNSSDSDRPANGTAFPSRPPAPGEEGQADQALPPLEWELAQHGGSSMYETEDQRAQLADQFGKHNTRLRLPEGSRGPQPFTLFTSFLGPGPIDPWPGLTWLGPDGYQMEPRFVGHGSYEVFGIAFEQNRRRADVIGHQLLLDLDLRLTGTERFHVQYRPIGERNTGGSYYMFNTLSGYVDNSTAIPDRYWFEFSLDSVFGGPLGNTRVPLDYQLTLGKLPLALHNNLLINDEVLGIIVSKNTILVSPLSNLNVQAFWLPDDVDAFTDGAADVFGAHIQADYQGSFAELTYAYVDHRRLANRSVHYAAASYTEFLGPLSLAGRALLKMGDQAGRGNGELFVLESNYTRVVARGPLCELGVEEAVYYVNGFAATSGWNSISGGNFNRLTTSFAVNPLVAISASPVVDDRYGAAAGVQLFRHHQDESVVPEIAYERADGSDVYGIGLQYLLKLSSRTYLDVRGVAGFSSDPRFRREGAFVSYLFNF